MAVTRHLILGRGGDAGPASLLLVSKEFEDFTDDEEVYNLLAISERLAPAGVGGEAAFHAVYIPVVYEAATLIRVTPIIDGEELAPIELELDAPSDRQTTILEAAIKRQFENTVTAYATRGNFAPRGTWFQVKIETVFDDDELPAAYVCFEGIELEIEVVREGKRQGANP